MDVEFLRYQFQDGFSGVIAKNGFRIGVRHLQMAYMFVSSVVMGAIRGSIGIAVLAMTYERRLGDTYIQIHTWDRRIQGAILSSFFIGYAILSLPAEMYLKKLSGKYVVTAMLAVNGGLSVGMPTIANKGGWIAVCNAMLFMGMAHAGFSSVNKSLIDKWLPPNEKPFFNFLIYGGVQLGIIIALPASGLLSEQPLGWELVFYSMAMMSLAMAVTYGILTASTPNRHDAIGDKEKEFIRETHMTYNKKSIPKPWKQIVTSLQFWSVACAHAASNAVFIFFLVDVPANLKLVMPLSHVGTYSMIPFVGMWMMYIISAPSLGWISNLRLLSFMFNVTNFRKAINLLGSTGVIVGLLVSSLCMSCKYLPTVVMLNTLILNALGLQFSGFLSSYNDMSENHAGTLMMLGATFSSIVGAAVPFINGLIVTENAPTLHAWNPVYVYLACMYMMCNITYTVFGSNSRQPWDWDRQTERHIGHYNIIIDAEHVQLEERVDFDVSQEKRDNDTAC